MRIKTSWENIFYKKVGLILQEEKSSWEKQPNRLMIMMKKWVRKSKTSRPIIISDINSLEVSFYRHSQDILIKQSGKRRKKLEVKREKEGKKKRKGNLNKKWKRYKDKKNRKKHR